MSCYNRIIPAKLRNPIKDKILDHIQGDNIFVKLFCYIKFLLQNRCPTLYEKKVEDGFVFLRISLLQAFGSYVLDGSIWCCNPLVTTVGREPGWTSPRSSLISWRAFLFAPLPDWIILPARPYLVNTKFGLKNFMIQQNNSCLQFCNVVLGVCKGLLVLL